MKKYLILLVCLFLITGCDVTYNLDIDGIKYDETASIIEKYENVDDTRTLDRLYNLFNVYVNKPIPISTLSPFISETNEKVKGVAYYDVKNLSTDDSFGMELIGNFDDTNEMSDSNVLAFAVGKKDIKKDKENVIINVQNFKIFKQFDNIDNVTVNLKSKNKVISHNADKVSKNIYTWYINKNNYKSKIINIEYKAISRLIDLNNPMIRFTIVIAVLLFISAIVYLLFNNLYKKKNAL